LRAIAKSIHAAITSLDGYVEDAEGKSIGLNPTRRCTRS